MAFGVELPENLGTPNAAQDAGTAAPEAAEISPEGRSTQAPNEPLDLDKHDTFRFKGRDWTRDEFEKGYLRHQDYTQKTQALSERTKYVDNFAADLGTVAANPSRMADFERMYPREFVQHAKTILARLKGQPPQTTANPNESKSLKDDPDFQSMNERLSAWEKSQQVAEVQKIQSWLDNQYESLGKKYPFAHQEIVNARAEIFARQNGGDKVTGKVLEDFFRSNNDEMKKRSDELYKNKITKQLNAGREARDVGTGGDIAGGAPRTAKTLKQAKEQMLADLSAGRLGAR